MKFTEALKMGRPIRRAGSEFYRGPWLHLGCRDHGFSPQQPCWRRIDTGQEVGLHSWDYLADDWEVMP